MVSDNLRGRAQPFTIHSHIKVLYDARHATSHDVDVGMLGSKRERGTRQQKSKASEIESEIGTTTTMAARSPISLLASVALALIAAAANTPVHCFRPVATPTRSPRPRTTEQAGTIVGLHLSPPNSNDDVDGVGDRRRFLARATAASAPFLLSAPANAGIDVSGLRVEGAPPSNDVVASQLKGLSAADSGTAAARVREINAGGTASAADRQRDAAVAAASRPEISKEELGNAAVYARVTRPPSIGTLGFAKLNSRYAGAVDGLPVSFDFPTDWLQLDRANGGIQYVDQRNGSKLYVLKAPLPADTNLATVPKKFFDDAIFDEKSDVIRFGTVVGGHKAAKSTMLQSDPNAAYLHRRLQLNYETVSGNGVQTIERRGLVDAYEIDGAAYMMFASANAVKFERKDGPERATIDMIADSFRVGQ